MTLSSRFLVVPACQKRIVEKLWRDFFSNPSQWWDHRAEKANARFPDFKHKKTQEGLWLNGKLKPEWVDAELAALAPGRVQSSVFSWNSRLARYVQTGQYKKTVETFQQMQRDGTNPNSFSFISVLHACASLGALEEGRIIHSQIIECGCDSDVHVSAGLVAMYAKCRSLDDAQRIFDLMPRHNVISWNALIMGYGKCGQGHRALELHQQMQHEGVKPDSVTFIGLLNACARVRELEVGKSIHEDIIRRGYESDVFLGSSLVDMYSKCWSIDDAWGVFSKMPKRNVVAWSAMIQGYVKCGQGQKALELCLQMQQEGVDPDPVMFLSYLNACASVGALDEGRRVHQQILQKGYGSNVFLGSSLVDMYAKCGSIGDAWSAFNQMPLRNVVAWSAMIQGYVKCGQAQKALDLFREMQRGEVQPDGFTFVGVLNACASVVALEEGRHVHGQIIQRGFDTDVVVGSSLVDMYAKCGSLGDALGVFKKMHIRNVVTWSAMIQGYVKCGEGHKALELYEQLQQEGVEANSVTFLGLLNACASVEALEQGRQIHEQISRRGWELDPFLISGLINMYGKCGSIKDASRVFEKMPTHDLVSWNAIIQAHVNCGQGQRALDLYPQMQQEGIKPDSVTFVGLVNACASLATLQEGKRIHGEIIQKGVEPDVFLANSLVDMYAKCGSIDDALSVFSKMPKHNVVSWNSMIGGLVKFGKGQKALAFSDEMQREGVEPDLITFVSLVNACASIAAVEEGKRIHQWIIEENLESDSFVGSSLVDMYAKCGSIEDAWRVFNKLSTCNLVSWNAMLGGYALHGHAKDALGLFERMCQECVDVDRVTFVSLLSACSHGGLVDEGLHYFESMGSVYNFPATMEDYVCMIDLLGRAGRVHQAEDLIEMIPFELDASVCMSLLGACRVHSSTEIGERIAEKVLQLEPGNAAGYVLLSNIHAAAGKWNSRAMVQRRRIAKGVKKQPASTWIELNNRVHTFNVNDQEHPQILEIHSKLKE